MVQKEKVVSHFSKKFNNDQMKYLTAKQELLAITETLKYSSNFVYDEQIMLKLVTKISHMTEHVMKSERVASMSSD